MIHSMTGFGAADRHVDGVGYRVEIRSVNNRYFKTTIRLPELLQSFETEVEQVLRRRLFRGSISYVLRLRDESATAAYQVNVAALRAYIDRIRAAAGEEESDSFDIDLAGLLVLPGVCSPPEIDEATQDRYRSVILSLTEEAVTRLIEMRRTEGQALRKDLLSQCDVIRAELAAVEQRGPRVVEEYGQRLQSRVNELLAKAQLKLDQDSLVREVALFADRCDVHEEVSRLTSHLDQVARLCDSREEAGRKLDFLAQEMLREANTIGSKSGDGEIAHRVVTIKTAVDRIKEQVQNVL
jgi:uncharacterized protein (TIGR00255 family)